MGTDVKVPTESDNDERFVQWKHQLYANIRQDVEKSEQEEGRYRYGRCGRKRTVKNERI